MLKPEYLNALPEPLVLLMQQLEEWTIRDIARRLATSGVTETARYQWGQLTDFYDETELRAELNRVTGEAQDLAGALYDTSVSEAFNAQQRAYARAGKTAAFDTVRQLLETSRSRLVDDVLNLTGSLGFAVKQNGKIVFQGLGQFYIDALNRAQMEVVTGVSDAQSAIRRAVKEMANSGLRTVDYAVGASMRIDAAARRAVMTGVNQATARMTDRLMEELGAEYVETTAHAGARPDHQVWQGRQFKVNGSEPGYPNFALSTGYGTVTGLCGANCYHSYYPYFPGYSTPAYTREELKHIDPPPVEYEGKRYNAYEATQLQRKYERNIRASRDKLVGYDAAGLSDDFMTESVKLKALERGYRDFSKLADLPTQNDRLQMLGFDRSVSGKAVWANKGYLAKYSGYRYTEKGTIAVTDNWKDRAHFALPSKYRPYAVIETVTGANKQIDRTIYDADGVMIKQIHSGPHSNPKRHPYGTHGEHKHDIWWLENGRRADYRAELDPVERKEHADIL